MGAIEDESSQNWVDIVSFDTIEIVEAFGSASCLESPIAQEYFSYIDLDSCITRVYIQKRA